MESDRNIITLNEINEFLEKIIFEKIIDILLIVLFGMILASLVSFLTYTTYEIIFK